MCYNEPRISRIQMDRQIYPSYAKIRPMRSKMKGFETILLEILSEICEDPAYASPTYARFTVIHILLRQENVNFSCGNTVHSVSSPVYLTKVIS